MIATDKFKKCFAVHLIHLEFRKTALNVVCYIPTQPADKRCLDVVYVVLSFDHLEYTIFVKGQLERMEMST